MSLEGKKVALLGFGDIGFNIAKRLVAADVQVIAYDPAVEGTKGLEGVSRSEWPERVAEADFIVLTCSLNRATFHIVSAELLEQCKDGVKIVNVARGALIDEEALVGALSSGKVSAAALDVFELEPLPTSSALRDFPQCIFGSHNGSNTKDAVIRTSHQAIKKLHGFLYDA